ncbi:MAG: aminopeptidase [Prevotella sp.]|nr:aminopeptidase [Prevotella sp.]
MAQKTFRKMLLLLAMICLSASAQDSLLPRLQALQGVSDVKALESDVYKEKYVMKVCQMVVPGEPQKGMFRQRVIVCHVGFDRPTILVTEGYYAHYALRKGYQDELSKLFDANVITVEYRYFGESMPEPCNWDYLTVENSLADLHRVNQLFRQIYKGKWAATGISKGGQTTMFYRAYYPDDVDVSVPYVAPLNKSLEDGRHEPFLAKKVGTKEERQRLQNFQTEVLKRRATLVPMFRKYCDEKKYTFRAPIDEIFDLCVLEYPFAIWQWGTPINEVALPTATDEELFANLIKYSEPNYFSEQSPYLSFNVQAVRELGYYGYDTKPFRRYLSRKSAHDYMHRVMLPSEFSGLRFDKTLYKRTRRFLKRNDASIIYIYGGVDPWGASGVGDIKKLQKKQNLRIHTLPGGSHSTRINSFPEPERQEIIGEIGKWILPK